MRLRELQVGGRRKGQMGIRDRKEIDLKAALLTAPAVSELLNLTLLGLRHTSTDIEIYKMRVNRFVSVFMRGLQNPAVLTDT